jgi:hypothetical protein
VIAAISTVMDERTREHSRSPARVPSPCIEPEEELPRTRTCRQGELPHIFGWRCVMV